MKYLIIGASIAGTTAAETIRHDDPHADITLITNEAYPLYSRIAITQYAAGCIARDNLFLKKTEQFQAANITFIPNLTALSINRNAHAVSCKNEQGEEKQLAYDKLLIATGGHPNPLHIPSCNARGVMYLYNLDDSDKILHEIEGKKYIIVAGGGCIGKDFVSICIDRNIKVGYLIRGPRYMHKIYDERTSDFAEHVMREKGVELYMNEEITGCNVKEDGWIDSVTTNITTRSCDLVGLGLGINRINDLIRSSTLSYDQGLKTNEYLTTDDPDIFAAGDVTEFFDIYLHQYRTNGDWASARTQGQIAAKNMQGIKTVYAEVAFDTVNVFGTNITTIGEVNFENTISFMKDTEKTYARVITRDSIAIGGIVIGDPTFAVALRRAIKERKVVHSELL